MKINGQKPKVIKLSSKQKLSELCFTINETSTENVHVQYSFKLLGIDSDEILTWKEHDVNLICKIISFKLSLLYKLKEYMSINRRKLLYNAYILSNIDCCSSVCGNLLQKDSDRIIKLRKRVARVILECDISVPSNGMCPSIFHFRKSKIPTINSNV